MATRTIPSAIESVTKLGPRRMQETIDIIVLFVLFGLTLVVMGLASGLLAPEITQGVVVVPLYVFLYGIMGGLVYVFVNVSKGRITDENGGNGGRNGHDTPDKNMFPDRLAEPDSGDWFERINMSQIALYLPAAALLSGGAYLVSLAFYNADSTGQVGAVAGIAFLVGLFIDTALQEFKGLTGRILGEPSEKEILVERVTGYSEAKRDFDRIQERHVMDTILSDFDSENERLRK